jgi:hypothetical protein
MQPLVTVVKQKVVPLHYSKKASSIEKGVRARASGHSEYIVEWFVEQDVYVQGLYICI